MPQYGTLGYQGPSMEDRLRGAFYRKMALQRSGPGGRGGAFRSPFAPSRGGRERMESRYAERAARERAERAQDAEQAIRAEESRAKLEAMRAGVEDQQAQTGLAERELSLKERLEPERLSILDRHFAQKMGMEEQQLGLAGRELDYRTGPAHELARYGAETERMGVGKISGEDRINAIAMMNDPDLPHDAKRAIAGQLGIEAPKSYVDVPTMAKEIGDDIAHIAQILQSRPEELPAYAKRWWPDATPEQFKAALEMAFQDPHVREAYAGTRYQYAPGVRPTGVEPYGWTMRRKEWMRDRMEPTLYKDVLQAFQRKMGAGATTALGPSPDAIYGPRDTRPMVLDAQGRPVAPGSIPIPRR